MTRNIGMMSHFCIYLSSVSVSLALCNIYLSTENDPLIWSTNRITITFHMLMGQHLGWLLVLLLLLDMQSIPVFQMVRHVCIPLSDSSTRWDEFSPKVEHKGCDFTRNYYALIPSCAVVEMDGHWHQLVDYNIFSLPLDVLYYNKTNTPSRNGPNPPPPQRNDELSRSWWRVRIFLRQVLGRILDPMDVHNIMTLRLKNRWAFPELVIRAQVQTVWMETISEIESFRRVRFPSYNWWHCRQGGHSGALQCAGVAPVVCCSSIMILLNRSTVPQCLVGNRLRNEEKRNDESERGKCEENSLMLAD